MKGVFAWWTFIVLCVGVAIGIPIGATIATRGAADIRESDAARTRAWEAVNGWEICVTEQRLSALMLRGCYGTDFDGRDVRSDSDVATESTGATLPP